MRLPAMPKPRNASQNHNGLSAKASIFKKINRLSQAVQRSNNLRR